MLRAIHVFPEFVNRGSIEVLRNKYDPLANLIAPHVTLVFPFESAITTEVLRDHVSRCVTGVEPFEVMLSGVTGADHEYLFLNVKVGNDELIKLHDRLYSEVLEPFLDRSRTYIPHLTVGRLKDRHLFESALTETATWNEVFVTTVREVVVETIAASGQSATEMKVEFPITIEG